MYIHNYISIKQYTETIFYYLIGSNKRPAKFFCFARQNIANWSTSTFQSTPYSTRSPPTFYKTKPAFNGDVQLNPTNTNADLSRL